jgi:P2-related tail formation protein
MRSRFARPSRSSLRSGRDHRGQCPPPERDSLRAHPCCRDHGRSSGSDRGDRRPGAHATGLLPWLAAHDSVDLWFPDWSVARKRQVIAEAISLARVKGTRAATLKFLSYVDGTLLDIVSYPARFVMGRAVIGRSPVGHKPFVARHLVNVVTHTPKNAFVMGRAVTGRSAVKTPSRKPMKRAMAALRAAKSPDTEYRVDFGSMRPLLLSDGPLLSDNFLLGGFVARNNL